MKRLALLALALLAWVWLTATVSTVHAYAPQHVVIGNDNGGLVADYAARVRAYDAAGATVVIAGRCMSACTAYSGARRVCVTPDAELWFHGARNGLPTPPGAERQVFEAMRSQQLSLFPPRIRAWAIARQAVDDPNRWTVLRGSELHQFLPLCRG